MRAPARYPISLFVLLFAVIVRGEGTVPGGIELEKLPTDPGLSKIVLIAGSSKPMKPGEHDYVAACAALHDLLQQSPGVAPVLAMDWPVKPETLAGAKAVVLLFDGGDKHGLLQANRHDQVVDLANAGAGFVFLHQLIDVPVEQGDEARKLAGAAWEKGFSARAHWVAEFRDFPEHPVFRGVKPFKIDDGWLTGLRFVPDAKGIFPLLRTVSPTVKNPIKSGTESVVAWTFDRPGGGRSLTFTGGHLHSSLGEEGYRRFLVNAILWTAGKEIPRGGAPVNLTPDRLKAYLAKGP